MATSSARTSIGPGISRLSDPARKERRPPLDRSGLKMGLHSWRRRSMLHRILTIAALAAAGALAACGDRTPLTPAGDAAVTAGSPGGAPQKPERLAREFAKALRNPAFRAYLKAQLDASPFPEHKLQFQTFLGASGGRALRYLEAGTEQEAKAAIPLEIYLPVPAHRAAWTGDENVLVATAITDRDVPVAFDPRGGRHLLDAAKPPETPVLALVPVETDFTAVAGAGGGGGAGAGGGGGGGGGGQGHGG